jgi:TonB-dependent SusC/RagA subfamily outer membrane receptor
LSANGVPGGAVSVRIRGVGSITAGNDPLYIVDGIQMNSRNDGGGTVSANPLAFLNPNDIESMEILKDAANASIYGAQAANGVVIITTKKGKQSQKTNINLGYYRGIVEPMPILDMMSSQEWIQARQEALQVNFPTLTAQEIREATLAGRPSGGGLAAISGIGFPANFTDAEIAAIPNYNWQAEAFKPGTIDNYDFSMSSGSENTTLYLSGSYNKQEGSLINIDFERVNGKINVTHKVTRKLSLDLGLNLSSITQRGPYGDARGTTAFGAPQYASPTILPFNPIYIPETGSTVSATRGLPRMWRRRWLSRSIERTTRPCPSSMYQHAVVTGAPSARTVPTTAGRAVATKRWSSGGRGAAGTVPILRWVRTTG